MKSNIGKFIHWFSLVSVILVVGCFPFVASAACNPKISLFTGSPLTVSEEKPLATVAVKATNLNTCTSAEKAGLILYIKAEGVGDNHLMDIPLEYAGSDNEYYAEQSSQDVVHPNAESFDKKYPSMVYQAFIAKKGTVTAIGATVYAYPTKVSFKITDPVVPPPNDSGNNVNKPTTPTTYAGRDEGLDPITSPVTGGATTLTGLIARVIQYALATISMVAIVVIILAGFRMIAGSGDEKQRTTAKRSITWAIIGLVLALLSFSIVSIVQSIIHQQS